MKFSKKKLVAAILAALCVFGVADLTLLENSNIKDVLQKVEAVLGDDGAADTAPLTTETKPEEAAPGE